MADITEFDVALNRFEFLACLGFWIQGRDAIDGREDLDSSSSSSCERANIRGDIASSGLSVIVRHRCKVEIYTYRLKAPIITALCSGGQLLS
jgi:hypothetical protein